MVRFILSGALGAACLASIASAQNGVYVDFVDDLAVADVPTNTFGGAAGVAGTWNGVDPLTNVGGVIMTGPLMDSGGNMSTIELTIDGLGATPFGLFFDEPNTTGDDASLLDDVIYYGGAATWTFTNLPAGNYDVYTYAMAPDSPTFETSVEVTGSPDPQQIVGGDFSAGYVVEDTHALHSVTVGAAGTIEIITDSFTSFDSIAGIQIVPSGGVGGIGSNYCTATANSTGAAASISGTGSAIAADNNVTLSAADMPPMQFGIFLTSTDQAATPVASGTLCLGGNVVRFQGAGQILQADANGEFSLQIDITSIPAGVPTAVMAGDVWNYQAWFRDVDPMQGNTANFTNGLSVTFL